MINPDGSPFVSPNREDDKINLSESLENAAATAPSSEEDGAKSQEASTTRPTTLPEETKECKKSKSSGEGASTEFELIRLADLDNHTGVLHVWFLVLEGLANTVATCPKAYQPQTLEMLFELLRATTHVPG